MNWWMQLKSMNKELIRLKNSFGLLRNWRIRLVKHKKYAAEVSFDEEHRKAVIYAWPSNTEQPKDFLLHEILHLALRELDCRNKAGTGYEAEEQLVQDICKLFREGIQQAQNEQINAGA